MATPSQYKQDHLILYARRCAAEHPGQLVAKLAKRLRKWGDRNGFPGEPNPWPRVVAKGALDEVGGGQH